MKFDIINLAGEAQGAVTLNAEVFGAEVRADLMHRYVMWQQQNGRKTSGHTKGRSDTAHSTHKIYRQKGTGGARHGARSANQFRGGGVVFGPRIHTVSHDLPKKVRRLALKSALSSKVAEKAFVVLSEAKTETPKTKELAAQLTKLELTRSLVIVDSMDNNFAMASSNLPHVKVLTTEGLNVYDILRADKLVVTKDALALIESRLNRG